MANKTCMFWTGHKTPSAFDDTLVVSLNAGANVATYTLATAANLWYPNLHVIVAELNSITPSWSGSSIGLTFSVTSGHKFKVTAASGTMTSVTAKQGTVAGGAFSKYLGLGTSFADTGNDATLTTLTATADNYSSGLFKPTIDPLKDFISVIKSMSISSRAINGDVYTAYLGAQVQEFLISLFLSDSEALMESSYAANPSDGNRDTNTYEYQWKQWAQGKLFSFFRDNTETVKYNIDTAQDGYRVFRLHEDENEYTMQLERSFAGLKLFHDEAIRVVEVPTSMYLDEGDV